MTTDRKGHLATPQRHAGASGIGGDRVASSTHPVEIQPRLKFERVSVVIPARDEERNIGWVLRRMPDLVDEVILVDGLSRDATIDVAQMVLPQIVIVHELDPGKGNALRAGFEAATGDVIVMMDADGSMDPAEIPSFLKAIEHGADVAKGSRFLAGAGTDDMTRLRQWGNAGLLLLSNLLYRTRHSDLCYGYLAFRRSALGQLQAEAPGFEIEMQLVARMALARLHVTEVPSHEYERMHGTSSLRTFRDGWRVLWTMLRERAWRPQDDRLPSTHQVGAGD